MNIAKGRKNMNITEDLAAFCERTAKEREKSINSYCSCPEIKGTKYYLSLEGDDGNDGLSPEKPWKSINKINVYPLKPGDGVFFRRSDVFRGNIAAKTGVTYAAYGKGKRPELRGSPFDLAEKGLWHPFGNSDRLWELSEPIRDCGTLVFNEGEAHAYKHIPSVDFISLCGETAKFHNGEAVISHFAVRQNISLSPISPASLDLFTQICYHISVSGHMRRLRLGRYVER